VMLVTRGIGFLCWNHKTFINGIAHVVRAWDVGSGPMAFVGVSVETTKHLSGMGPVSLIP
jgi:hypothetical protein